PLLRIVARAVLMAIHARPETVTGGRGGALVVAGLRAHAGARGRPRRARPGGLVRRRGPRGERLATAARGGARSARWEAVRAPRGAGGPGVSAPAGGAAPH